MSGLYYPNRLVRALFQALRETAGPSSLGSVLDIAGLVGRYEHDLPPDNFQPALDFVELAAFNYALEEVYGARGGRGIALRTGTAFFEHGIKGIGVLKGVTTPEFAMLPAEAQAQISLMGLASVFNTYTDQKCRLEESPATLHFIANPSPFAWDRISDKPVCHLMVGGIQACLRWATGGYEFAVYEVACRSTGADECVFQIAKKPIGRV